MNWTDATIDDIRDASPETLNRWACEKRDLYYEAYSGRTVYRWEQAGCPGLLEHGETDDPVPFAQCWWAAGPLLEDLDEPLVPPKREPHIGEWVVPGWAIADTAPEAITRAYLIAAKRGLL